MKIKYIDEYSSVVTTDKSKYLVDYYNEFISEGKNNDGVDLGYHRTAIIEHGTLRIVGRLITPDDTICTDRDWAAHDKNILEFIRVWEKTP